jgi:Co/Zn/Cd efflux system component
MILRQTVILVACLNLAYFGVEFAVALAIGSVSLFADSIDFLEDASINLLIAVALGWSALNRSRLGMALAAILLVPAMATLWTAWQKFAVPVPPAPLPLTLTGAGALALNLICALVLARFRSHSGVPVGAERRLCQCRHRARRLGHRPYPVGLARPGCRSRHRRAQRRRCPRRVAGGAQRAR